MWRWVTSSERAWLGAAILVCGIAAPASARVFLTVDEALELAFPDCRVERKTVFLTEAQVEEARELAGGEVESALVHPYVARCEGDEIGGVAYFDSHRVRTLPETLMVVVGPDDEVARVEVLSFQEPPDYIPREAWYDQFTGRRLDPELAVKRDIRGVTGATLTARATTEAVRRVLAVHQVLRSAGALEPADDGGGGATP